MGDFPGSPYAEFVQEVKPPPVSPTQPSGPPIVPRRRNKPEPADINIEQPPLVSPKRKESLSPPSSQHDLFKVIIQIPVKCAVCEF